MCRGINSNLHNAHRSHMAIKYTTVTGVRYINVYTQCTADTYA